MVEVQRLKDTSLIIPKTECAHRDPIMTNFPTPQYPDGTQYSTMDEFVSPHKSHLVGSVRRVWRSRGASWTAGY